MTKYYFLIVALSLTTIVSANNLKLRNIQIGEKNVSDHYSLIMFDVSWENSWRCDLAGTSSIPNNWDAAWVFVKYRVAGGSWQPVWLNDSGHTVPAGGTIDIGLLSPGQVFNSTGNPGLGVFIYRSNNGSGDFSLNQVKLRWNYGANGIADDAAIDIQVFAIEMVYVPGGNFYVGSGGSVNGELYKVPNQTDPFQITSEEQIIIGSEVGNLYYPQTNGNLYNGDQKGPIPAPFPKGFNAFYCMKYEISQQAYVDFLNNLTTEQAPARFAPQITDRFGILIAGSSFITTKPFLPCNFLGWDDMAAYLDWSGLRPMTELEYEKAFRGPLFPVVNEYAWGSTGIANLVDDPAGHYTLVNMGELNEGIATNYRTDVGNVVYARTKVSLLYSGPLRSGIFAGNAQNTGRITAGASYYGILEMTGNLWERIISIGTPGSRGFAGTHGDGRIGVTGNADASTWPGIGGPGAGFRGGGYSSNQIQTTVSARHAATGTDVSMGRNAGYGGRGVRSAL